MVRGTDTVEYGSDETVERIKTQGAQLYSLWQVLAPTHELTPKQIAQLNLHLFRFDFTSVQLALADAINYYLYSRNETIDYTIDKIGGICHQRRLESEHPELAHFRRIYYLATRKFSKPKSTSNDTQDICEEDGEADEIFDLLDLAQRRGVPLQDVELAALMAKTKEQFKASVIARVRAKIDEEQKPDLSLHLKVNVSSEDQIAA